ncbi:hypothetical protein FNF27_05005 [Cafeteria roenbergensis]|uniref:Uncharacterized protein n=1 Tax=Cafeteria roenbergensis TaxID=33653 RepID=A0A5A8DCM0_CAFRO|nr:hypothetical protein FNF31_03517 [Cafeteria roenbergensis]KAA0168359.1 hypothetical protein FNF28_02519 [Cafeteria roenbergensis]KAA0173510.1 hypothetical protein FNF27_05005 [Cafeteria roenbergensis]
MAAAASTPTSVSSRKRSKGKTAASLALFPIADETFVGLLPRYPAAAAMLRDPAPLRKGKWSKEEDELATTCISHFMEGLIPLTGIGDDTLRGLLSYMLHSDGMRVTKKFAGELSIRKQQYVALAKQARANRGGPRALQAQEVRTQLAERFLQSLESRGPARRRPASATKGRAPAKRKRSEPPAKPGKVLKSSKDDSPMALELMEASAAALASLHRVVPAATSVPYGFHPQGAAPGCYPGYMGGPVATGITSAGSPGQYMTHPSQMAYPFAGAPHHYMMPAHVPPVSMGAGDDGSSDPARRALPGAVVPMMPAHSVDLTSRSAMFAQTPPPGAFMGGVQVSAPHLFAHDSSGVMRPVSGRPMNLPTVYSGGQLAPFHSGYPSTSAMQIRSSPDAASMLPGARLDMGGMATSSPPPQSMGPPPQSGVSLAMPSISAAAAGASAAARTPLAPGSSIRIPTMAIQHRSSPPSGMDTLGAFADEALKGYDSGAGGRAAVAAAIGAASSSSLAASPTPSHLAAASATTAVTTSNGQVARASPPPGTSSAQSPFAFVPSRGAAERPSSSQNDKESDSMTEWADSRAEPE